MRYPLSIHQVVGEVTDVSAVSKLQMGKFNGNKYFDCVLSGNFIHIISRTFH
jgi:hypothetical protein